VVGGTQKSPRERRASQQAIRHQAAVLVRPRSPSGRPHPVSQPQRQPRTPQLRSVNLERLGRLRLRLSRGGFETRKLGLLGGDVGGVSPVVRLSLLEFVLDDFRCAVGCTAPLRRRCEPRRLPGVSIGYNRDRPRGYVQRR
jgi:hypothetical protein